MNRIYIFSKYIYELAEHYAITESRKKDFMRTLEANFDSVYFDVAEAV